MSAVPPPQDSPSAPETRFAAYVRATRQILGASNPYRGLTVALGALDLPVGSRALVPSLGHPATVHAIEHCGLRPSFVDVNPHDWCLHAEQLNLDLEDVSVIVATHLFGAPCDVAGVQRVAESCNAAVVYDGTHAAATWVEGRPVTDFGDAGVISFGDSEHATRRTLDDVCRSHLKGIRGVGVQSIPATARWAPRWCVASLGAARDHVYEALRARGIVCRRPCTPLHLMLRFAGLPRTPLPVTESLGAGLLAVALSADLDPASVLKICELIISAMEAARRRNEPQPGYRAVTVPPPPRAPGWRLRKASPSRPPAVDVYSVVWNDMRMLPYFLRHYRALRASFYLFDDGSTDSTWEFLAEQPDVTLEPFVKDDRSTVLSKIAFYNQVWKASRGRADWVIVCDIDEHLHHPQLAAYLERCHAHGVTLIQPTGYQMAATSFPATKSRLCDRLVRGVRFPGMDKPILFAPDAVQESNFAPGRHTAEPTGHIVLPSIPEVKLLHYRLLGVEYTLDRDRGWMSRLGPVDVSRSFGEQYRWSEQRRRAYLEACVAAASDVVAGRRRRPPTWGKRRM